LFKLFFTKLVLVLVLAHILSGCVESRFELDSKSRLPKWFEVPEGMSRDKLKLTMDYYIYSDGGVAVFKLYDENGDKLKKIEGKTGLYPIQLKNPPHGFPEGYPLYEIVDVNGVKDIVEHRERNNVFHMTDNPVVWEELGIKQ
jgi:hypothetical protein